MSDNKIITFRSKDIRELSKEELIEALEIAVREMWQSNESLERIYAMRDKTH